MRRKWGLVVFLCLVVALGSVRLVSSTGSNGVPTSFYNCGTSEPTINSNTINVIVCDDFERSRTAANVVTTGPPGTWYVTNCDNPAGVGGESNPPNKGWCGNIFNAVHADSGVTTPGVNSTAYAAYSNPNNGADNLGSHNFQTTCQAPSVLNVNCRITGASNTAHYDEIYVRFYAKYVSINIGPSQNLKFLDINRCCTGTGSIDLLGSGPRPNSNNDGDLIACPPEDCNSLDTYRNPQNPVNSQYLYSNDGANISLWAGASLGHWFALEWHLVLNTPNVQNGILEIWGDDCGVNGTSCPSTPTRRFNYNNVRFRGSNYGNSGFSIGSIVLDAWTNDSSGSVRFDQFVVSTQRIGWMNTVIIPPPSAPSGVSVTTP